MRLDWPSLSIYPIVECLIEKRRHIVDGPIEKSLSSPTKDTIVVADIHDAIEKLSNNPDPFASNKWVGPRFPDLMTPEKVPTRVDIDARPTDGFQYCIRGAMQNTIKKEE